MAKRFLLLGMNGELTRSFLAALAAAGHRPVALLLPAPDERASPFPYPLPVATTARQLPPGQPTLVELAQQNKVPIWLSGRLSAAAPLAWLQAQPIELIIVACFPWRLPAAWLSWPAGGAFNIHPSLLPAYRGPTPLFWQLRDGVTRTGVTLHQVTEQLDAGPIVAQQGWPWQDGWTESAADKVAGARAGQLLSGLLNQPLSQWPSTPQDEALASYQPAPTAADMQIMAHWSARRAVNFVAGTEGWGGCWLDIAGEPVVVRRVLKWAPTGTLPNPFQRSDTDISVRFQPGVVTFAL